ncbi:guanylate kinase [candidate division WOR-3 bacterium]|nr:guanylate kinase [candidate division WOR-3 bacterium]
MRKKLMITVSGPSGAGKTTICRELKNRTSGIDYIVSATSRPKRDGETEGQDYFFVTENQFKDKIKKDEFLEWAVVHGFYYGTPLDQVENTLKNDNICLLDLDVQGAAKLLAKYPLAITIFVLPPSPESLELRLKRRGTESSAEYEKRIENAGDELKNIGLYKYAVRNDDIEEALRQIQSIITAEKCLVDAELIKEVESWIIKILE